MGQRTQVADARIAAARTYPKLAAMSADCSNSRIWSGAPTRAANDGSRRLGALISGRALMRAQALS